MSAAKELLKLKMGLAQDNPPRGYIDFRKLIDLIAEVLKDSRITQADLPVLIEYAEELFETHVRPFDIPYVGPVVEKYIDDALKASIAPIVTMLFNQLVRKLGPEPGPSPSPSP
jgi:hypothetical protein